MKRDKYDITFSLYIRLKAKFKCERCGKQYTKSDTAIQCSHYMGRTNQATRYDEENGDCFCYGCHAYFEDRKQTAYRDWKIQKIGLERVVALEARSYGIKKWKVGEKDALRKYYQDEIKKMSV